MTEELKINDPDHPDYIWAPAWTSKGKKLGRKPKHFVIEVRYPNSLFKDMRRWYVIKRFRTKIQRDKAFETLMKRKAGIKKRLTARTPEYRVRRLHVEDMVD